MALHRARVIVIEPPAGERWPALRCGICDKTLVRLRDCGAAGLAVISVDRHGGALRYDVDNMDAIASSPQAGQLKLHRIASLEWRARSPQGGYPPQSYEFHCGRRCPMKPIKVRNDRLTQATQDAVRERRDVVIGIHL